MNIYSLPDILALIFNGALAIRSLALPPKTIGKYWLFALLLLFMLWNISGLVVLNIHNHEWILLSGQVIYRILFLFPAFILAFAFRYYAERKKRSKYYIWYFLIFLIPASFLAMSFPNFNLKLLTFNVQEKLLFFALNKSYSPLFYILISISVIYVLLALYIVWHESKMLTSIQKKNNAQFLIFGVSALFFGFFIYHIISWYTMRFSIMYPFKTGFLFLEVFYFYVVIDKLGKEHFSGSDNKNIRYLIFTLFLTLYFIFILVILNVVDDFFHIHNFFFNAVLIFILTLFFEPVQQLVQRFIITSKNYRVLRFRNDFLMLTQELVDMLPNEELLMKIRFFALSSFHCKDMLIFRFQEDEGVYEEVNDEFEISNKSKIIKYLIKNNDIIEYNDVENVFKDDDDIYNYFLKKEIQFLVPIHKENELIMFFAISKKTSNEEYSMEEFGMLSIFANEVKLYLQRNFLFEKIQSVESEKIRLEKLAGLGQLTAGIAHEIRNPLNTISSAAQTLQNEDVSPEIREKMSRYIEEETIRLNDLINDFLQFSKVATPNVERVDFNHLLEKLQVLLKSKNADISFKIDNQIYGGFYSDSKLLYQILSNLGLNALEALEDWCKNENVQCNKGLIVIRSRLVNNKLFVHVINNGPAIPKAIKSKIFEPFYTTKDSGTGMGLALIQNILKGMDGNIKMKSVEGETRFSIQIPVSEEDRNKI